ncbi:MAG: choice-of-anchor Q domain-containing protein [Nannocystaceae bacterium]
MRPPPCARLALSLAVPLTAACHHDADADDGAGDSGSATASGSASGSASRSASAGDTTGDHPPPPELPQVCEGFDAQDISNPTATITGADCNEAAIRAAVEAGGTIVLDCPDAPVVFTAQMEIGSDTVIDGSGVTVLDGGGTTRLIYKGPGPTLWLQNLTMRNAQGPEALGDDSVTQANWFDWAGGAIVVQCHDNSFDVGGGLFAKNFTCTDSRTGSSTRDPMTGQILDTGSGGCIYSFMCTFHCDGCDFRDNHATLGGAVGTLGAKVQMTGSSCIGNQARFDTSTNDNQGYGGCYYQDGTETAPGEDELNYVRFCGNLFEDNAADVAGGTMEIFYRQGTHTSIEFQQNLCRHNVAGTPTTSGPGRLGQGGCLYVFVDPDTQIEWAPDVGPDSFVVARNAFIENTANDFGGGAAIYNIWDTAARLESNLFLRNDVVTTDQQGGGGGGLGLIGAFFDVEHNTFAFNTANNWSGGLHLGAGGVGLRNNLFFQNTAPPAMGETRTSDAEHVNWKLDETDDGQDNGFLVFASAGNLFSPSATPWGEPRPSPGGALLDVDPALGEPTPDGEAFPPYVPLQDGSPAIDAGVPTTMPGLDIRGQARDAAPDIGCYER